ncbi:hypothetical protein ACR78Z_02625 [Sphingobacterium thalpophilum]|uniref:Lipocalin-like domain-containing protein n=1 Tax=Sphingobacterium thalpophilum TaxID=259 RepID=A0A4U9W7S1_9SPHI|nr:hypothetical protein [Sphingobacterium thalpophilum]VTR54856.1 Uncharacterised protein [Sphingobacterium thalpophilum]
MLTIKRRILARFNFVLLTFLLLGATSMVMFYENPERLLEGEWEEQGWYFEKVEKSPLFQKQAVIHERIKDAAIAHLPPLKDGLWHFEKMGEKNFIAYHEDKQYNWFLKGRGHILELRKNNQLVESFVIQKLDKDQLVLHLNLDIQTKGIARIVLKKGGKENYAKKI